METSHEDSDILKEESSESTLNSLNPQELKDLQWPISRKGWQQYWQQRLGTTETANELQNRAQAIQGYLVSRAKELGIVIDNGWQKEREEKSKKKREKRQKRKQAKAMVRATEQAHADAITAEDIVSIVGQDPEDFNWPPGRHNFGKYWKRRFGVKVFPKSLCDMVVKRIGALPGLFRDIQDIKKDATRERDMIVKKAIDDFVADVAETEDVTVAKRDVILKTAAVYQEERDLSMIPEQHPQWIRYWARRLAPELDILPAEVKSALHILATVEPEDSEVNPEAQPSSYKSRANATLRRYILRRLTILRFQLQKRLEMKSLKEQLRRIDHHEDTAEAEGAHRRAIFYDAEQDKPYVEEAGGRRYITEGDIVADCTWGVEYRPDNSVPSKLWRRIEKLSVLKKTRDTILNIYNNEISATSTRYSPTTALSVEYLEANVATGEYKGALAERMVQGLLTRFQYNYPELGLRVESSNVFEDVALKYDFKVIISVHRRGVALEGEGLPRDQYVNQKRRFGIQLMSSAYAGSKLKKINTAKKFLATDPKAHRFSKKPVDDIVLVRIPLKTYESYFMRWLKEGKPMGGPEQYLTKEEKTFVLQRVTENIIQVTPEELFSLIQ